MKNYAEILGSNIAALLKVRQVKTDIFSLCFVVAANVNAYNVFNSFSTWQRKYFQCTNNMRLMEKCSGGDSLVSLFLAWSTCGTASTGIPSSVK